MGHPLFVVVLVWWHPKANSGFFAALRMTKLLHGCGAIALVWAFALVRGFCMVARERN